MSSIRARNCCATSTTLSAISPALAENNSGTGGPVRSSPYAPAAGATSIRMSPIRPHFVRAGPHRSRPSIFELRVGLTVVTRTAGRRVIPLLDSPKSPGDRTLSGRRLPPVLGIRLAPKRRHGLQDRMTLAAGQASRGSVSGRAARCAPGSRSALRHSFLVVGWVGRLDAPEHGERRIDLAALG